MGDLNSRISAPAPEVQHIPTIFRRLRSGEIRFPAFQRSFSWSEEQILALLDSVHRGYPIGSMLLWKVESRVFRTERLSDLPMPDVPGDYPVSFVLDGLQRLSSLYGVFHNQQLATPSLFNVVYDLRSREFRHFDPQNKIPSDLPLSALFTPKLLLDEHARLYRHTDGDALVTESIELQSIFQGYMVPTVTIANLELEEVVEIFARINSTGNPLGQVDFMRALTWSNDFDLSIELEKIQTKLAESGFEVPEQSLMKAVAVVSGRDPIPEPMLTLRDEKPDRLHNLMSETQSALEKSVAFLRENGLSQTSEFLPYEGQFLALNKVFATTGIPNDDVRSEIIRWFWSTSLNEDFRGKPDNFVARMVDRVAEAAARPGTSLNSNLSLSLNDLIYRRLIRGKALSSAVLSMFGKNGARSLITGELIPRAAYLEAFNVEAVIPIFTLPELQQGLDRKVQFSRLIANILIVAPEEEIQGAVDLIRALEALKREIGEREYRATLESQFMNELFVELVESGNVFEALSVRAERMYAFASSLVLQGNGM